MDFETQKHSLYGSFFRFGISCRGKQTGFLSSCYLSLHKAGNQRDFLWFVLVLYTICPSFHRQKSGYFCLFCSATSPSTKAMGKTAATRNPFFRSPPAAPDTNPTDIGPIVPPRSPASAKKANIAVPPLGQAREERLRVPGHMIPTENPHNAQPAIPATGYADRNATQ